MQGRTSKQTHAQNTHSASSPRKFFLIPFQIAVTISFTKKLPRHIEKNYDSNIHLEFLQRREECGWLATKREGLTTRCGAAPAPRLKSAACCAGQGGNLLACRRVVHQECGRAHQAVDAHELGADVLAARVAPLARTQRAQRLLHVVVGARDIRVVAAHEEAGAKRAHDFPEVCAPLLFVQGRPEGGVQVRVPLGHRRCHLGGASCGLLESGRERVDGRIAMLDFLDDGGRGERSGDHPSQTVQREEPPFSRLVARD